MPGVVVGVSILSSQDCGVQKAGEALRGIVNGLDTDIDVVGPGGRAVRVWVQVDVAVDMNPSLIVMNQARVVIERDGVTLVGDLVGFEDGEAQFLVIDLAIIVVAQDQVPLASKLRHDLIFEALKPTALGEEQVPEVENGMSVLDCGSPALDHDPVMILGALLILNDVVVPEVCV